MQIDAVHCRRLDKFRAATEHTHRRAPEVPVYLQLYTNDFDWSMSPSRGLSLDVDRVLTCNARSLTVISVFVYSLDDVAN